MEVSKNRSPEEEVDPREQSDIIWALTRTMMILSSFKSKFLVQKCPNKPTCGAVYSLQSTVCCPTVSPVYTDIRDA